MDTQEDKTFDPTIHTAEYVSVDHDESFAQIREKLEAALARTPNVILVIPRGAQAFHTTQDFLALGKVQWRREVRVAVATPDPTIAGLARVLGFHIVETPADHPALAGDPGLDNGTNDDGHGTVEKPTSPLPLGGLPGMPDWVLSPNVPSSTYTPRVSTSGNLTTSTWLSMPGDGMGAQPSLVAEAPRIATATRSGQPPPRRKPRQTGHLLPTQLPEAVPITDPLVDESEEQSSGDEAKARLAVLESKAYKSGRGWRYNMGVRRSRLARVLVSVVVLASLALVAVSGYAYVYLPEGKVSVVPQSKIITGLPVRINVLTGQPDPAGTPEVTPPPEDLEPGQGIVSAQSLQAGIITKTLQEEGTAPATGTRQIPRGRGAGTMHFVNTTAQAQLVAQGTTFNGPNGVTVQTTEAGTVQATNFAAQQFGTLDLPIVANVDGPDGNIEAGKMQGTYKGVLTYFNYAMQGGSLETVKVVTQEDIDKLVADLSVRVDAQVSGAVLGNPAPGQVVIPSTIRLENKTVDPDRKAGEDGDSVTVKVTGVATGNSYDQAKMNDQIRQAVYDYVQSGEPAIYGPVTDLSSINFADPVMETTGSAQGVIVYESAASARVKYALTPDLAGKIRTLVKGKSVQAVPGIVSGQYGSYVAVSGIKASVLWFNLDKLPDDPTRIQIEQSGSGSAGNTVTVSQPSTESHGEQR